MEHPPASLKEERTLFVEKSLERVVSMDPGVAPLLVACSLHYIAHLCTLGNPTPHGKEGGTISMAKSKEFDDQQDSGAQEIAVAGSSPEGDSLRTSSVGINRTWRSAGTAHQVGSNGADDPARTYGGDPVDEKRVIWIAVSIAGRL